jgi:hypothetical protein
MAIKITYQTPSTDITKEISHGDIATIECKDKLMEGDVVITSDCETQVWILTLEDGSTVTKEVHIE